MLTLKNALIELIIILQMGKSLTSRNWYQISDILLQMYADIKSLSIPMGYSDEVRIKNISESDGS